jgi:CubicO group peptidase (beta-lactamase class C family)
MTRVPEPGRRGVRSIVAGALLLVALAATPALVATPAPASTPTIPDTPAGAVLKEFLDVVRSGDIERARAFLSARYTSEALAARPVESRLDGWRGLMNGLADPRLLELSMRPGRPKLVIESGASGQVFEVVIQQPEGAPDKVGGVLMQPTVPGKPEIPAGSLTDTQRAELLDRLLDRLVADDRFSGVVTLAKNGRPVYQRAAGLASRSYEVPNRVDTKFCLGSMNKMFTSLAIARLVQDGKVAYGDKVGKYLPDFPNADVRDQVTIHHLLTHTSGLGSYFGDPEYALDWASWRRVRDYTTCVANESLAFEPGARMSYSNSGFIVLGLIIEQVTGRDYYDYVRDTVFKPAGMVDTDSYENDHVVPNLATGYTTLAVGAHGPGGPPLRDAAGRPVRRTNYYEHSARGTPAGGGYSTAPDLVKFSQALAAGTIVSAALVDSVTTARVAMGPGGAGYGYGFFDQRRDGHGYYGHNGGAPGMSTDFRIYEDLGYTVVVLSNYDGVAGTVADFIDELLIPAPDAGRP